MSAAPAPASRSRDRSAAIRIALGVLALGYVGVLLLAPVAGIVWSALQGGWGTVLATFSQPDVRHAFYLTGVITVLVVVITTVLGTLTGLVLARDCFPGRSLLDALVDLPFALSPVIVGLMCILLFGRGGWFEPFFSARGIQVVFALPSMVIVTAFIAIPFTIREVAPTLKAAGAEEEEAARTLGASPWQSFWRITLPKVRWALAYGVALSAARALGEVGAVLIVSGAIQGQTETATLYVYRAMESRQSGSAYVVALSLAVVSVLLLSAIEIARKKNTSPKEAA